MFFIHINDGIYMENKLAHTQNKKKNNKNSSVSLDYNFKGSGIYIHISWSVPSKYQVLINNIKVSTRRCREMGVGLVELWRRQVVTGPGRTRLVSILRQTQRPTSTLKHLKTSRAARPGRILDWPWIDLLYLSGLSEYIKVSRGSVTSIF